MVKHEPKAKAKAQDILTIGGTDVSPGQNLTINLPIADLYTNTQLTMPIRVARGKSRGPTMFVSAAVHGDEINGVEIIRRLLNLKLLNSIKGTLIAVPVVNVFGFVNHSRYLPDRRDLNRSFPGSEMGSLAGRLANLFLNEIVSHCTHGIDLHTGSNHRTNLPQIRALLDNPENERLANAFGAPVILNSNLRDGSLREAVANENIPMLLYEAGEPLRFDEMAIRFGVRGITSVMREIGMLPPRRSGHGHIPLIAKSTTWVRAPHSGLLRIKKSLGARVEINEVLGQVAHPLGRNETEVLATKPGVIIGQVNLPLINEGDALFHIASLEASSEDHSALDAFQAEMDESNFSAFLNNY